MRFVGSVNSTNLVDINFNLSPLKAYTSSTSNIPVGDPNYVLVCENTEIANIVYFPIPLIWKGNEINKREMPIIKIGISKEQVTVKSEGNTTISTVQIVDLLGRDVVSKTNINANQVTLSISSIKNGTYLVKVIDSQGKLFNSKLLR